jgi:hypothetical protein
MQRRAAAAYAGLFILIAVGAYVMVGFAQEPAVSIENPDHSLAEGDSLDVGDRTYTVDGTSDSATPADRSATLSWTNESERQTATLDNGSDVPVADVVWSGQTAREEATFRNGSSIQYNGSEYTLTVGAGEVTLERGEDSVTVAEGETFRYRDNQSTVTAAGEGNATVAWGGTYVVFAGTPTNDSMSFRQSFNVSGILTSDPDVQNESFSIGDEEFVRYRNGSTQLLPEYLPDPENETFSEGDAFSYDTAEEGVQYDEVTVANVTAERVLLTWRGPVVHEVSADHGGNVTLGPDGQAVQFAGHFPDNGTLELTSDVEGYRDQLALQDSFRDRVNGLWGVSILSGLAAVFLIGAAYLPSRY